MEKNIASSDASDMMVYEGMRQQSRRFHLKPSFAPINKITDALYQIYEYLFSRSKRGQPLQFEETGFPSMATAIYSIIIASVLISFFWLTLLLSPTT